MKEGELFGCDVVGDEDIGSEDSHEDEDLNFEFLHPKLVSLYYKIESLLFVTNLFSINDFNSSYQISTLAPLQKRCLSCLYLRSIFSICNLEKVFLNFS